MARTRGQLQVDFLEAVLAGGGRIVQANLSVERAPLEDKRTTLSLVIEQHQTRTLHQQEWTAEVEEWLLGRGVQMQTNEEEAERFAVILLNNLASIEARFGKDYAHAVLVDVLRGSEYGLDDLLAKAPVHSPDRQGGSYGECAKALRTSIDGLRQVAVRLLHHSEPEVAALVAAALRIVVDETFYISSSQWLFPRP